MFWITNPGLAFAMWLFLVCTVLAPWSYVAGAPLWVTVSAASVASFLFAVGFVESKWNGLSKFMDRLNPSRSWPV
jgi:hypothetical protein